MKRLLPLIAIILFSVGVRAQTPSDTCVDGNQLTIDTVNKRYKCVTPGTQPPPVGSGTNMIVPNASSTGTTLNKFAKLTGAPSTAVISSNGDTENAIGIVIAGAGTTGNATITILGQVSCVFDGATTAGNYVTIAATGGGCHDAGSSYPASVGATYGRVLSTNGGAGTYVMELMTPDIAFQNAGNGKSKPGGTLGQIQFNNSGVFGGSGLTTSTGVNLAFGATGQATLTPSGADLILTNAQFRSGSYLVGTSGNSGVYMSSGLAANGGINLAVGSWLGFTSNSSADTGLDMTLRRHSSTALNVSSGDNCADNTSFCRDLVTRHYLTSPNCLDSAGAAACGAASAGSVVIDAGSTSVVVSTTSVTADSQIFIQDDSSLGTRLSVTCNTQALGVLGSPRITARTAATSFTVTVDVAPTANPLCLSYFITN